MKPGFEPDDDVAEICRRLDGLPLALELAAARVKVLTPAQILERLEHRLDLLTGGVRDAPERQRTLRATLEWSHDLLDETERRLFRRLSVFAGAFTLEAVEAVCQAELDTLASLVDKQLLRQTDDACFFMLETIREYAAEQLEQHGEAADFRSAHAEYYLTFSERAAPELRGPSQDEWMARIQREHANFAVAMAFFVDGGLAASALRIGGALTAFWERRGRAGEGRALLEAALQAPSTAAADVRARALYGAGKLAYTQDDHERGRACCEEALALFRRAGDASGEVLIEIELAWTAVVLGDLETATAKAEQCVERARSLGDRWVYAYALRLWGAVLSEAGQLDEAKRANRESLAVFEACGDPREQMGALSVLGWLAIVDEEYEEAGSVTAESIARASEEDAEFLAIARSNLGLVNLFLGRDERAVQEFSESLRLGVPLGAQRVGAESLLGLAALATRAANYDGATRLRGASLAIHEACGATLNPAEERVEERFLSNLDEPVLRAAEAAGRSLSLEEAAAYAVEVAAAIGAEAP